MSDSKTPKILLIMSCTIPAGSTCAEPREAGEKAEGDGGEGFNGAATKMLKLNLFLPNS